ncbi:ChaN family lipoprotein [Chthonobacter albigriseus]|uniref:ChaN family lipoprotein n=1 Tax=Chthonobacter albigriseus TaxID=1683161 RepID=UPI0015EF1F85|nr:ChaN family lipoprotein [Chthonobacter albigriseus]
MPCRLLILLSIILLGTVRFATAAGPSLQDLPLQTMDIVILGEIHDDPAQHRAQADVLSYMLASGQRPTVVFEMIPADLQPSLDGYLASTATADQQGLDAALKWKQRGWGEIDLYWPVFEVALAAGLPIRAGDLSDDEKRLVSRSGASGLTPARRAELGLDVPLPQHLDQAMQVALAEAHCNLIPAEKLPRLVEVQRARDGAMAIAAARAARSGPVVLVTGRGHARRDWGVPHVLGRLAPEFGVYAIAFGTAEKGAGRGIFDAVLPSTSAPPTSREDPCDSIRPSE